MRSNHQIIRDMVNRLGGPTEASRKLGIAPKSLEKHIADPEKQDYRDITLEKLELIQTSISSMTHDTQLQKLGAELGRRYIPRTYSLILKAATQILVDIGLGVFPRTPPKCGQCGSFEFLMLKAGDATIPVCRYCLMKKGTI